MHNLLDEALFTTSAGRCTLPAVLAMLSTEGPPVHFLALQPHDEVPWYCFLVQLAAVALGEYGVSALPWAAAGAAWWRIQLLALTGGDPEPWDLVRADLTVPAFLQSPTDDPLSAFARGSACPDYLSSLRVAKGHDIKLDTMVAGASEDWVYALVGAQTIMPRIGSGREGIVRMQHGGATRMFVSLSDSEDFGVRFRADIARLLSRREAHASGYELRAQGGVKLLWLVPWSGTLAAANAAKKAGAPVPSTALDPSTFDPYFIEVASRLRLVPEGGQVVAYTTSSADARVDKVHRGHIGDPWGPEDDTGTLVTIGQSGWFPRDIGWSYEKVTELLWAFHGGTAYLPLAGEPGGPKVLICNALVHQQQRAYRFFRRVLPIPADVAEILTTPGHEAERAALALRARAMVDLVVTVQQEALVPALHVFVPHGATKAYLIRHDTTVDRVFFADLWAHRELPDAEALELWLSRLLTLAEGRLEGALRNRSMTTSSRLRLTALATARFVACRSALKATMASSSATEAAA